MAMDDILGNITKALKNVFKDETDDVIEKVGKDIIENASDDLTAAIKSTNSSMLERIISHDVEHLNSKKMADYLNSTSIFKNNDDFMSVVNYLAKNGGFEDIIKETAEEATKATSDNVENIFDYLSKSGQKTLNKNRNKSLKDYQRYATSQGFSGIEKEFKNKNFDDPRLQNISKILNKDAKDMTWDEIKGAANKEIHESYNRKATFTDVMGYYKVPQIATGVAGTAWLVNKLSDDRGQQTNAQLYNQEPY